jgi:hypothetical protein
MTNILQSTALLALVFIAVGAIVGFLRDDVFVGAFAGVLFFAFAMGFGALVDKMGKAGTMIATASAQNQAPGAESLHAQIRNATPIMKAACMEQGSACKQNSDCCQGLCNPRGKCGR